MKKQTTVSIIITLIILVIISLITKFLTNLAYLESFRIVFGSIFVLFIPGFIISFIFFKSKQIEITERIALSFALSIAIVPLAVFYLNLIGIKINLLNSFLTIIGIIILSLLILQFKKKSKIHLNQKDIP